MSLHDVLAKTRTAHLHNRDPKKESEPSDTFKDAEGLEHARVRPSSLQDEAKTSEVGYPTKQRQNRWMGRYKAAITKRIAGNAEPFRQDAEALVNEIYNGHISKIVAYFKNKYNLSLADATCLTVFFHGCYNNGGIFTTERYLKGLEIAKKVKGVA